MGPTPVLRELLGEIVDFAGLFPPAKLAMSAAVAAYDRGRGGESRWMLARFVVPAGRIAELSGEVVDGRPAYDLSVLLGEEIAADLDAIRSSDNSVAATSVELKAGDIDAAAELIPREMECFFELELGDLLDEQIRAVAATDRCAKIRTGGIASEWIPAVDAVAEFLLRCQEHRVPFKATAGLHHPVRGEQSLHYGEDAPRDVMHGFLNLFLAATLLQIGRGEEAVLLKLLSETDEEAFRLEPDSLHWRDERFTADDFAAGRRFARSFGSCSFDEPVDDLRRLRWL